MGRKRSVHLNLPRGMRARVRPTATYYFYDTGAAEIPLGKDYVAAVRKWAELEGGNAPAVATQAITFRTVAEKYLASPKYAGKAPRTQKDNLGELNKLYAFFDSPPAPLDAIAPHHIAKYRDWRKSTHSTQEIALLSSIWSWAREQGYTDKANPTLGVERNRGSGRDVFITDELFARVYAHADQPTRDAMDLAHLAGQRPGDSLRMTERDIKATRRIVDGQEVVERELWVQQGKTGARLRVRVTGKLAEVVDRILARKATLKVRSFALVVNERGQALSASALDGRFGKAREAAGIGTMDFQFRDLRAKAGTEAEESRGMEAAQGLLGHASQGMTRHYVRHRLGKLVDPTK
jgi:integrase